MRMHFKGNLLKDSKRKYKIYSLFLYTLLHKHWTHLQNGRFWIEIDIDRNWAIKSVFVLWLQDGGLMLHILRFCFVFTVTGEVHEEAVKSIEQTTRGHHLLHQLILRVFVESWNKCKILRHFLNCLSITKLGPHVIESVILLLDLFALNSINDYLCLIVRSKSNLR